MVMKPIVSGELDYKNLDEAQKEQIVSDRLEGLKGQIKAQLDNETNQVNQLQNDLQVHLDAQAKLQAELDEFEVRYPTPVVEVTPIDVNPVEEVIK